NTKKAPPAPPSTPSLPSQADFDRLKKEIEALKQERKQPQAIRPPPSAPPPPPASKTKKPASKPAVTATQQPPRARRVDTSAQPARPRTLREPPADSERNVRPLATQERSRYRVQLGAHRQRIDTNNQWLRMLYKHGRLLAPYQARVEAFTRAQTTYYRLQIVPFASRQKALALCNQLKRLGEPCWVVYPDTRDARQQRR
ncbi:MAG: SPOR domain-containing protein, partial [Alphaproteobacteria bacterium GM202ARS2]|nr:SPOR domain-containing protein [Alphaproteobacteria bacterium GM202ARS2]